MKKLLFYFCAFSLLFVSACSDSDGDEQLTATPVCSGIVNNFTISQHSDYLTLNLSVTGDAFIYEVSMVETNNSDLNPLGGIIEPMESVVDDIPLHLSGSFAVFVRTVCADGTKGAWSQPKLFNVQPFCNTPEITSVSLFGVDWLSISGVATYQLQYGPEGFELGTGTTVNVNNNFYSDMSMAAGQAYDFYVRPYCPASSGFGNWSQKYTYIAEGNVNMCAAPTNITPVFNSSTNVTFHFNGNGEDTWECALISSGQPPAPNQLLTVTSGFVPSYNISSGYHGTFYIRAVCNNGNRTQWVTLNI